MSIEVLFPDKFKEIVDIERLLSLFDIDCLNINSHALSEHRLLQLEKISQTLLNFKEDEDLVSLGFWLRKSNLLKLLNQSGFVKETDTTKKTSLGKVFHIAPTNVPTMFMYSFAPSYLAGNHNIIKVSKKNIEIVKKIIPLLDTIEDLLIITYNNEKEITEQISEECDARLVWGGDDTGELVSNTKKKLGCRDLIFRNKVSAAIINCNTLITDDIINKFLKDSTTYNQKACSSPTLVVFVGEQHLRSQFISQWWDEIRKAALQKENLSYDIERLNFQSSLALSGYEENYSIYLKFPLVINTRNLTNSYSSCGFNTFFQYESENLKNLYFPENIQTITYHGFNKEDLFKELCMISNNNISRIVPIGRALDFSFNWDGYNILEQLSKDISII